MRASVSLPLVLFVFVAFAACEQSPVGMDGDPSALTPSGKPAHAAAPTITVGGEVSNWESGTYFDPPNGLFGIGGSGQLNGEFTIAERDGVQIALRAQERFVGPLPASGKKIGRYEAEAGFSSPGPSNNNATWNYDIHVDLRGSGTTWEDYDVVFSLTNVIPGLGPIDLTLPDNTVLFQTSQNPGFGNDTFDPEKKGTYNLKLALYPKDGGPELSVAIQVRVR